MYLKNVYKLLFSIFIVEHGQYSYLIFRIFLYEICRFEEKELLKSAHVAYFIERCYTSRVKRNRENSFIVFEQYTLKKKHSHFVKVYHVIAIHL